MVKKDMSPVMRTAYEKPTLVSFSDQAVPIGLGRGECNTGTDASTGNCKTGYAAYKDCVDGGYANASASCATGSSGQGCSTGSTAEATPTSTQCCSGGGPEITNASCYTGAYAGKACSSGTYLTTMKCS